MTAAPGLRLNLGCGGRRIEGCLNVDKYAACSPDQVVDLEQFPWPWADDSVSEIHLIHVLEHLGQDSAVYLKLMQEMWRVCRDGAVIHIIVPHPRHDSFLNDPTHVRPVTGDGLLMFSHKANKEWDAMGAPNTPLGKYLGIDFRTLHTQYELDAFWRGKVQRGEATQEQVFEAVRRENNVVSSVAFTLQAVKPAGRDLA